MVSYSSGPIHRMAGLTIPACVLCLVTAASSTDSQNNNAMRTVTASRDRFKGYANSMHTRNNKTKTVVKIFGKHEKHYFCCKIKTLKPSRTLRELMQVGMPIFICSSVTNQHYGT